MGEGNCARAGMATRSLRVERADALSDVSYRNYASDQSRAQISRNLGALHSAAVSNPLPTPLPPCCCCSSPHNYKAFQTVTSNQDERVRHT